MTKPIICYGEALWDCLPEGLFFGGAPVNVARHLRRLGAEVSPVTSVGTDFLGDEALDRMENSGLPIDLVHRVEDLPTGTVQVRLDDNGNARYTIREPVAWDRIPVDDRVLDRARGAGAVVYGTLAQRSEYNRREIRKLLDTRGPLKVYDVNLRPPHDDLSVVADLTAYADLLKVNEEELYRMLDANAPNLPLEPAVRSLAERTGVARICVTRAENGAALLDRGTWFAAEGRRVEVRDTVGAGDGFLAAFLANDLAGGHSPGAILRNACRFGEFIATRDGAVPNYAPEDWILRGTAAD